MLRNTHVPDATYRAFTDLVQRRSGIVLGPDKRSMLQARLQNLAGDCGYDDLGAFLDHLLAGRSEALVVDAIERLTTNHTYFWREPVHFELFRDQVVPELMEDLRRPGPRVWCAASSTGQEPWIIAGILQDACPALGTRGAILASDLSMEVLEVAKQGVYPDADVKRLPEAMRRRWMRDRADGKWEIAAHLRGDIAWRTVNLIAPNYAMASGLHAVFCRNVLIYFDSPTRAAVIRRLGSHLRPGGWLFLSMTEGMPEDAGAWTRIAPGAWRKSA
jgi:chemotaxis protein methyltransferase CheR